MQRPERFLAISKTHFASPRCDRIAAKSLSPVAIVTQL